MSHEYGSLEYASPEMRVVQHQIGVWQERTFGAGPEGVRGQANKLRKEADELALALFRADYKATPETVDELADMGILLLGLAHRLGADLATGMRDKMRVNYKRQWGPAAPDGTFQHLPEAP